MKAGSFERAASYTDYLITVVLFDIGSIPGGGKGFFL
jgi:hypothetical protein